MVKFIYKRKIWGWSGKGDSERTWGENERERLKLRWVIGGKVGKKDGYFLC